ncbi:MAG: hypothetical protein KIT25_25440 [Enhydrobacter sp.]|nr:MAG: hypothetical protein KIT25_25440 [Enhydrobacter sp.]
MNEPRPPALIDGQGLFSNLPQLVYLLYLLALVIAPAGLVGIVIAYLNRPTATDPVDRSHFEFQVATFWRGLVMAIVGVITSFFFIGFLILLFTAVWLVVRCVKGLNNLSRRQPMPDTAGWGFG